MYFYDGCGNGGNGIGNSNRSMRVTTSIQYDAIGFKSVTLNVADDFTFNITLVTGQLKRIRFLQPVKKILKRDIAVNCWLPPA